MELVTVHPLWRPYKAGANAQRQTRRIAYRQVEPGPLSQSQAEWAMGFAQLRQLIALTIPEQALDIRHVGSTAIQGMIAKPIIDVDLTVPDPRLERSYVPQLEAAGFRLIFRDEMAGDIHRQLTFGNPNANVHVWGPSAIEPRRHRLFIHWLNTHAEERARYRNAKQQAADAVDGTDYNDAKAAAIYDIYERAFAADPAQNHIPRPRDRAGSAEHTWPPPRS